MTSGRAHVLTMTLAGLAKFVLGIVLAIAILVGSSAAAALYLMQAISTRPPKPVFANDQGADQGQPAVKSAVVTESSAPTPTPSETPSTPLEPGAYQAKVTWSDGLSMRSEPELEAERIGGVEYNQQIVVLEESPDKKWQKIRLEDGEQSGWIKAGNVARTQ